METKAFLTVTEAAAAIGLGRSTTYRLVKEGRIPSVQMGTSRMTRIPATGLSRWIEERTAEAAARPCDSPASPS